MAAENFDVLVVGAGISGIGAGYHLQRSCPGKSYAILEGRENLGGTWDLFRYPGIRSDSDMYTLGYPFRPWKGPKSIADGPSIWNYVRDTAEEYRIDKKIRFGHHVTRAWWSTLEAKWTVEAQRTDTRETVRFTCNFLFMCSGYYNYAEGYTPDFAGTERFAGRIVHPQKWSDDVDYEGKRVVVIGSGATAVTLVPELAEKAAHVIMLQRSPTYMVARPAEDKIANGLRRRLPERAAYALTRWKNILLGMYFYQFCKRKPERAKELIQSGVKAQLGPDFDVDTHFSPDYNPWDQRLCLVPNGDLFRAINGKRASLVTDHIDTFTERGLKLRSGEELAADLIVTATGLNLQVLGGVEMSVDGERVDFSQTMNYKGMMYSDVPNLASAFGYTNASWTLKCDLTCKYVCRLLNHMDKQGYRQCTPRKVDPSVVEEPGNDLTSGYVLRSLHKLPKQGSKKPWKLYQNYLLDLMNLKFARVEDEEMEFSNPRNPTKNPSKVPEELMS